MMKTAYWVLVVSIILSFCASGTSSIENYHQAFPIVEPDPGHTKLRLSKEGLEAIERIKTLIAAVAVWITAFRFLGIIVSPPPSPAANLSEVTERD